MQEGSSDDSPDPSCGWTAVAIAFNWEKEPGMPAIVEEEAATATAAEEQPLTPPPGYRQAGSCVTEPGYLAFSGFEPEEIARKKTGGAQLLAEKIRKKLVKKMRRNSSHSTAAANCFSLDAFRGRLYLSDDSEERSGSPPVSIAALDEQHPDTPCSSNSSLGSSSSASVSSTSPSSTSKATRMRHSSRSAAAPSPSPPQQPSSQLMANLLLSLSPLQDHDDDITEDGDKLSGPRESAWHQPEEEEDDENDDDSGYRDRLRREWQLVLRYAGPQPRARSSSSLLSSITRQASKFSLTQYRLSSSRSVWEQQPPRSSLCISRAETR
ncbi:unnamed protein product [Sphagnum jensenii]|uniref:Uncharacterized protein n=1 Tax=Sphagnum jensenii TaxID=128206 RepID=A0ABP1C4Q0_9BRYO